MFDKYDHDLGLVFLAMIFGTVTLCFVLAYTSAHLEARAYERVTGKHVSTWDAMFLDLRVQESTDQ